MPTPRKNSFVLCCQRCHEVVASADTPLTLTKPEVVCAACHEHLLDQAREGQATKDHWNSGGISWND